MEIKSRNTNTLAPVAYALLQSHGILDQSRNGPVLRLPEPLTIQLTHPWERVNFCPGRDANPFFHFIEACAMLADENNAQFLAYFAKRMMEFSDDGFTFNAFYGSRLRSYFGMDQLNAVIKNLLNHPHSRQEVALMWCPEDLKAVTKDKACNLLLMFAINEHNNVVMTSVNRSNDAIWGMVNGANVVHLSLFHEYVARSVGRPMGSWFHFSNNFHIYTSNPQWEKIRDLPATDLYASADMGTLTRMFLTPDQKVVFDRELSMCIHNMVDAVELNTLVSPVPYVLTFIKDLVSLFNSFTLHKRKAPVESVIQCLSEVHADDWRWAAMAWISRRQPQAQPVKGGVL